MKRLPIVVVLSLFTVACKSTDDDTAESLFTDASTSGDGDGDGGSGDGDGAPDDGDATSGDGDGAPGDGDGAPGDGDGDIDACEDGDSGIEPFDGDGVVQSSQDEPHGGGVFIPALDVGSVSTCDIFMQDCPNGEKCVPYASMGGTWDANKCVPVLGTGTVGEPCLYTGAIDANDDCDEDSACWGIDNMSMGTCTAFCSGTPIQPLCPEGTQCLMSNQGSIAFCVLGCNPITQNCADGEGCFWSGSSFACASLTQDIPLGESCGFINDCAKGLACLSGDSVPGCASAACCAEFCDLDCGPDSCTMPNTSCTAFFNGNAPVGDADVGVCVQP